jgi:hypothetical protein
MSRELSALMARYNVELDAPQAVALLEPASGPMVLCGFASTFDVDTERVCFSPFAFELPADVPLHYDHTSGVAGRIETLAHSDRGELLIRAYVDHPEARRCNAFSVREISLVPAPGQPQRQGSAARATVTDVRVWRRLAAMCWITCCTTPIARRSSRASRRSGRSRPER